MTTDTSILPALTAWIVVILTSLLPRIILQEVFYKPVSPDLGAVMSLCVILIARLATLAWGLLHLLCPFLRLLAVLVASE